ncbi:MAG TPA: leucine zipper domain-containing protein [Candidatus Limnocylindria bacterium]
MLHRTARLTPFGRRLLVERVLVEGRSPAIAAETLGVSRATANVGATRRWQPKPLRPS